MIKMKIPFKKKSEDYEGDIGRFAEFCKNTQQFADSFLKYFRKEYEIRKNISPSFERNASFYTEPYVKSNLKKLSKIARKTKDEIKSYTDFAVKSGKAIDKRKNLKTEAKTDEDWIGIVRNNEPEQDKCLKLYNNLMKCCGEMLEIMFSKPSGAYMNFCTFIGRNIFSEELDVYAKAFEVMYPKKDEHKDVKNMLKKNNFPSN